MTLDRPAHKGYPGVIPTEVKNELCDSIPRAIDKRFNRSVACVHGIGFGDRCALCERRQERFSLAHLA